MSFTYQNPLPIKHIGDPFVLRVPDGKYYCYATSAPDGFKAWASDNFVQWKEEGYVYLGREDSWSLADFWAPDVVHYREKYYMHYSARWGKNKSLRIGVDDKAEYESFGYRLLYLTLHGTFKLAIDFYSVLLYNQSVITACGSLWRSFPGLCSPL